VLQQLAQGGRIARSVVAEAITDLGIDAAEAAPFVVS
jgi:pyruvate dehydrogenase complex dehydrogenase (E1) component